MNAVQATVANQPLLGTADFNYNPGLSFNGTTQQLTALDTGLVFGAANRTMIGVAMTGMIESGAKPNGAFIGGVIGVIVPLHLFSMFCIFYSLYFVAKTFKTVELQRQVSFSDFAGEFFMIWFYPIGIWIVQPKINKMIEE